MDNQNPQSSSPQSVPPPPPVLTQPVNPHKPNMLFLGMGAIVLLVIGLAGGYMLRGMNQTTPSQKMDQAAKVSPTVTEDISPTTIPPPTESPPTANWQSLTSKSCNFTFKAPVGWKVSEVTNEETERYNYGCVYINAPDFKIVGMDSDEGLSVGVLRTKIGTVFQGVTIDSLNNYITATETIVNPKEPAKNIMDKTIGKYSGKYFEYEAHRNMAHFVFLQGNYIYTIWWRADYQGNYNNDIDGIVSSITF